MSQFRVSYQGFCRTVTREFDTEEGAVEWTRQLGVEPIATITPIHLQKEPTR